MYSRLALVACALALVAVPAIVLAGGAGGADGGPETAAATVDTPNDSAVSLSPAAGPNGQYANVTGGELVLTFDDLNGNATTTADDVFAVTVTAASPAAISVQTDAPGVGFYWGDDQTASATEARTVQPGENVTLGVRADSYDAIGGGNFTVVAEQPESDAGGGGGGGGFAPPGSGDDGELTVTSADVAPTELAPGESATATATVENTGSTTASDVVDFAVDGTVVDQAVVTVGPESSETVSFERTFQQAGTFALSVGGVEAGSVAVTTPPANDTDDGSASSGFRVANASLTPNVIQPGGTTTATANVTNRGQSAGLFRAELSVGGVVVEQRSVRVAPGATERVTFERSFDHRGGYDIAVSGADAGTLRVESSTTTSMRRYGSEYGWLLGAATIPTLGGAFVAARRRGRFLED